MLLHSSQLLACVLVAVLLCFWRSVSAQSAYLPQYTGRSSVSYNENQGSVFPDSSQSSSTCSLPSLDSTSYFISDQNFNVAGGRLLIGAANKLYLLSDSLQCESVYTWTASSVYRDDCVADNVGSDQNSTCQNHIRVHQAVPSDPTLVLVCGTQASEVPQCRTVRITDNGFAEVQGPVTAADAFISYYPEFSGYGEFTRSPDDMSTSFFSVGFFRGNRGVGRDYKMAVYNVGSPATDLSVTESITTLPIDTWMKPPVTFVDYYRADYAPPLSIHIGGGTPLPDHYHFYFVFIRENLIDQDVIYSRVVRICRNDPGVDGHFSTYMKARIYCGREVPPGRQFIGALDYEYNNIESVAFNEEGRFGENRAWFKTMYGAFSGPRIGPEGTAICAYPADNSMQNGGTGFNKGIFDIFREDLAVVGGEMQNLNVECDPAGRDAAGSELIQIVQGIVQIGEDPLIVLNGIIVTQMVVDVTCVVRSNAFTQCKNQDVLFLGTDNGMVMKVVFATAGSAYTPVIAEEISLDNEEEVNDLKIETVGGEMLIFASTNSRIYRMPLERCSRFTTCSECVGARDPYCVWNTTAAACKRSELTASGSTTATVPAAIIQDIHTGVSAQCQSLPECAVTATVISNSEVMCQATCANSDTVNVFISDDSLTKVNCAVSQPPITGQLQACARFTGASGLQVYQCMATPTSSTNGGPTARSDTVMTPAGVPAEVTSDQIYSVANDTSLRVCVQIVLTDLINNYLFKVDYGTTMSLGSTSIEQRLDVSNCLYVSGLEPGSTVNYRVNVTNSVGSTLSPTLNHMLLDGLPGAVRSLTVSTKTSRTVSLSWMPPDPSETNGDITGYTVLLDGEEEITCILQGSTSYIVDGLLPYTEHTFSVQACTDAGEGQMSQVLTVRTDCESPGTVASLTFPTRTANILSVEWSPPTKVNGDSNGLQYEVTLECYNLFNEVDRNPVNTVTSPTSRTITGLQPLITCCATVSAYHMTTPSCSTDTPGPPIQECSRTLQGQPANVENFNLEVISATSIFAVWDPPTNYQRPGLSYFLNVSPGDRDLNITDRTNLYIEGLSPNTEYSVTISASPDQNVVGTNTVTDTDTTSPLPPSPPQNPSLSPSAPGKLTLTWDPPSGSNSQAPVMNYEASLRCNDISSTPLTTTDTTVEFDFTNTEGWAWCTAVVQAQSSVGFGDFSVQASTILPSTRPSKPTCYFTGNSGTNASISFTLTYPFVLRGASVNWTLYNSNNAPQRMSYTIGSSSPSVVFVSVQREETYQFELSFCNENGCSEYCDLISFNTQSTPPTPPESIDAAVDCCSANVTWPLPPDEMEGTVSYTVELSSSCSRNNTIVTGITTRWYEFTNLCSETEYSVAVRVTVLQNSISGPYGRPYIFSTLSGVPSAVRAVKPTLIGPEKVTGLTVNWAVPEQPNGVIVMYEIHWSQSSVVSSCDSPDATVFSENTTDLTGFELKTTNVSNLEGLKSLLVCVRAYTQSQVGDWGIYRTADVVTGGLISGQANCTETCSEVIIVAVIAVFAVSSSIILGVILCFVLCYNGWTPLKEHREKKEEEEIKKFSHKKPVYGKTHSIQSTSSQAPMINGSIS